MKIDWWLIISMVVGSTLGNMAFDSVMNHLSPDKVLLLNSEIDRLSESSVRNLLKECAMHPDKRCYTYITK